MEKHNFKKISKNIFIYKLSKRNQLIKFGKKKDNLKKNFKSLKYEKKILVVGGSGFLGFHLCKLCVSKGFQTFSVSKKKPRIDRKIKKS